MSEAEQTRIWRPGRPVAVAATIGLLRHGPRDPAYVAADDGAHWRASVTPEGPATIRITSRPDAGEVEGAAWGPGATWALETMPRLLGAEDDTTGFEPRHDLIRAAARRFAGWRVPRTGLVLESLAPAAVEQLVTGQEAFSSWRRLLLRFGRPAPGPVEALGLRVPPTAQEWAGIPS
ncbi:MAG: hypothetical protein ACJ71T_00520, partial [Actinomycetales bacterium]